jgi:hypothetical protein
MTRQEKSSRKRMAGRLKRRNRNSPATALIERTTVTGEKVQHRIPNRAQRKFELTVAKRQVGLVRRERARQVRKNKLAKARRVLKRMRRENRKAARRASR